MIFVDLFETKFRELKSSNHYDMLIDIEEIIMGESPNTSTKVNNYLCNSCRHWCGFSGCSVKAGWSDRNTKQIKCDKYWAEEK